MIRSAEIWVPAALIAFAAMEPWAALLHGRVWHGALWPVHKSHHGALDPERERQWALAGGVAQPRRVEAEANDWLSALHAPIAIAFIVFGCRAEPSVLREVLFGAGIGMSLFGVTYVIVHDGLVHQRLPVGALAKSVYLKRVRAAHLAHHRGHQAPYGLFLGPWELRRIRQRALLARRSPPTGRSPSPLKR